MAPSRTTPSLPLTLLTLVSLVPSTWAFDCKDIVAQSKHFNLGKLGGPHVVHWTHDDPSVGDRYNYNFTLDICNKLEWHKGGSLATECHHGARVCAIRETIDLATNNSTITPIDIAGTYTSYSGHSIDAQFELLRNSKSNSDADREGVRAELHGGRHPFYDKKSGRDQRAIIEFVCDKEKEGSDTEMDDGEHQRNPDDSKEGDERKLRRDDEGKGKCQGDADLRFCGYAEEEPKKDNKVQTLRLEWRTKYACEDAPADEGTHWGFFTWFIIILFLATAAYLIFGSWLNYNRYGARGWDLLPHGDTIRDIPYILKDFGRKVKDTMQGSGSRGGYSAV